MTRPCIPPEEMGSVGSLAEDHPIRVHLQECPRCQARLRMYESFLEDGSTSAQSPREAEADAVLTKLAQRHFGLPQVEPRYSGRSFPVHWWAVLSRGARARLLILTPAVAAAAILVAMLATNHRKGSDEPAYRGQASAFAWHVETTRVLPDGHVRLEWGGRPGADAYRVRVLDTALAPVFESAALPDTSVDIDPAVLGTKGRSGARFLWQVVASHQGEDTETSGFGQFRIP
jgi:hypothetical protein